MPVTLTATLSRSWQSGLSLTAKVYAGDVLAGSVAMSEKPTGSARYTAAFAAAASTSYQWVAEDAAGAGQWSGDFRTDAAGNDATGLLDAAVSSRLAPATAGRALVVDALGRASADAAAILGNSVAADGLRSMGLTFSDYAFLPANVSRWGGSPVGGMPLATLGVSAPTNWLNAAAVDQTARDAIAVSVESHLLDDGDGKMLINAIVGAIGNTNLDQVALVAAVRADAERAGGMLDVVRTRAVTALPAAGPGGSGGLALLDGQSRLPAVAGVVGGVTLADGAVKSSTVTAGALNGKGDWLTTIGNVTVGGYAAGQSPATLVTAATIGTVAASGNWSTAADVSAAAGDVITRINAGVQLSSAAILGGGGSLFLATSFVAPDNAGIATIKAKTNQLQFATDGKVLANSGVIGAAPHIDVEMNRVKGGQP